MKDDWMIPVTVVAFVAIFFYGLLHIGAGCKQVPTREHVRVMVCQ